MLANIKSFWRALSKRREFESSMAEELRFHAEKYAEQLMRSGVSFEEASRRATSEFGGLNTVKEECREARGLRLVDELHRQLSYAARSLRKAPGFTLTALLTLAICVGANLTIFAVIHSVLLRPLPFPHAERLVTLYNTYPKAGVERDGSSLTNYYERRGHIPAFSSLSIYRYGTAVVGEASSTEREQITRVSPEFFVTLGRGPSLGRAFTESETTYQTDDVVILTDAYWRQHFSADPAVLGRQLRADGVPKKIVGVLPPGFRFLSSEARLYFPLSSSPSQRTPLQRHSGGNTIQLIGRLQPDSTLAQAQAQIDTQNTTLELDDPQAKMMADAGFRTLVVSLHGDHVASIRPVLLLLQAGVFVLLLIGVANLVNLLLIRANSRSKELAVRRALGANLGHLWSEVAVETTFLTLGGGALGLGVAALGIRLLSIVGASQLPLGSQIAFDTSLAMVALLGSLVLGVVLAIPVAWFNSSPQVAAALHSETRGGTANQAAQRLRHSFIVAQTALAFVLLAGAGLLGLSLQRAAQRSPGFRPAHILTGQLSLPFSTYKDSASELAFTDRLLEQLNHQPGVLASGVVNNLPFSGHNGKSAASVVGHVLKPGEAPRGNYSYGVTGNYFEVMGFSLRAGRFLTADDSHKAARVCIVDEDFARYYWPHVNPIGQHLFQGSAPGPASEALTVVGVVGKVQQTTLTDEEAQGAVYYPFLLRPDSDIFIAVRTSGSTEPLALTLRSLVRQLDASLPVNDFESMEARISDSLLARRSPALLAAIFSAIAVLLTAIGTYGVLSYAVALRRREIGIRMALGAHPAQIRKQFLWMAGRLLAFGAALGLLGAWLAGRAMQSLLFHVPPLDLSVLAIAACVMTAVSLLACLLPSHRAARISPSEALGD